MGLGAVWLFLSWFPVTWLLENRFRLRSMWSSHWYLWDWAWKTWKLWNEVRNTIRSILALLIWACEFGSEYWSPLRWYHSLQTRRFIQLRRRGITVCHQQLQTSRCGKPFHKRASWAILWPCYLQTGSSQYWSSRVYFSLCDFRIHAGREEDRATACFYFCSW